MCAHAQLIESLYLHGKKATKKKWCLRHFFITYNCIRLLLVYINRRKTFLVQPCSQSTSQDFDIFVLVLLFIEPEAIVFVYLFHCRLLCFKSNKVKSHLLILHFHNKTNTINNNRFIILRDIWKRKGNTQTIFNTIMKI